MTPVANRTLLVAAAAFLSLSPAKLSMSEPEITAPRGSPPPHALQRPCGKRDDVVRMLREQFGETPLAHGLADSGAVAEVFTSSSGTWTIVATAANGVTCMVGSGQSWQPVVAREGTI